MSCDSELMSCDSHVRREFVHVSAGVLLNVVRCVDVELAIRVY